jgi:hypothetical protein
MAKGFAGTVFLTTDDCQATYEELKARGVEFTEEPEERPYGIDSASATRPATGGRRPGGDLRPVLRCAIRFRADSAAGRTPRSGAR